MRIWLATTLIALSLFTGPGSADAKFQFGITSGAGVGVPLSGYINEAPVTLGTNQRLGKVNYGLSYSVGATFLLNDFELGYNLNTFSYKSASDSTGKSLSVGGARMLMHQLSFGYRIYFHKSWIRPYMPLGLGFLVSTAHDSNISRKYGMDINVGFGLEFRVVKHFYIGIDVRYHFNLTNKPYNVIEGDVINAALEQGLSSSQITPSTIDNLGIGVKDAIGMFHYIDIRFGITVRI